MNTGRTVFAQLMDFLPLQEFRRCVERYQGDYKVQSFSCLDQFFCLAFAQLTYRESLRDIEACLRTQQPKLYHMGFRGRVSRNNLAMPMNTATGGSLPISVKFSSPSPVISTSRNLLLCSWQKLSMPWIPPLSIYVCRCSPGLSSGGAKAQSNCIPCSACGAAFPPVFT